MDSDIWLLSYKQNSFGYFLLKVRIPILSKNTQNCFAYNSITKYRSEDVLYSKRTGGHPLSPHIKIVVVASVWAEIKKQQWRCILDNRKKHPSLFDYSRSSSIIGWGNPSQLGSWYEGCLNPLKLSKGDIWQVPEDPYNTEFVSLRVYHFSTNRGGGRHSRIWSIGRWCLGHNYEKIGVIVTVLDDL